MASTTKDDDDKAEKARADEARARARASQDDQGAEHRAARARAGYDDASAAAGVSIAETPEQKAARANDSIGAQVILDPASDAALAARGGAAGSIEENTAVRNASLPRIIGLSKDTVGGTVTGPRTAPKLHRPVPWYEPPATGQTPAEVRTEALAQIVSP